MLLDRQPNVHLNDANIQLTAFFFGGLIVYLLLFYRRVVVDEDERLVIFGVAVALSTFVAGT